MLIRCKGGRLSKSFLGMQLNPYQIIALGFALAILSGAVLLMLPKSSQTGEALPFIDALFTATSAICVTGLTVVDTGNYFSVFGQIVLIVLIQIGGFGIMTITTMAAVVMGRRIHLSNRLLVQESLNQFGFEGMVRLVLYIVKVTFCIEFLGGTILAFRFALDYGWEGVYYGYWHAVSAFCNAGFDIFGGTGIFHYAQDPVVVLTLGLLIIFGGIGFTVIEDVFCKHSWHKLAVQSKVVLSTTAVLLLFGTVGFFLLEQTNYLSLGALGFGDKMLDSFFVSVTSRTAGYTLIDTSQFTEPALLLIIILMFIGASPSSTGGGIRTSTLAVILASGWTLIRGRHETVIFSRAIPSEVVFRALAIFFLAAIAVLLSTMYLCAIEGIPVIKAAFEVVSAFATVGLSTGVSPALSIPGKLVLILLMFMGRVGIVTFAMALAINTKDKSNYQHPVGKFIIG